MRAFTMVVLLLVCLPVLAAEVKENPIDRETLAIASMLRCTVCQNQPVSESHADLAADMRRIIREQLVAGKSRKEIIDYFVARYGDYVLMKPPYDSAGTPVWVGPLVFVGILGISAFFYLRRRLRTAAPPPPAMSEEDAARVREAKRQATQ